MKAKTSKKKNCINNNLSQTSHNTNDTDSFCGLGSHFVEHSAHEFISKLPF